MEREQKRRNESELVNSIDAEFLKEKILPVVSPVVNGFWDMGIGALRVATSISRIRNKETYLQKQKGELNTKKIIGYTAGVLGTSVLLAYGLNYAYNERVYEDNPIPSEVPIATNLISLGYALAPKRKTNLPQ